jgi:hypothetical protein
MPAVEATFMSKLILVALTMVPMATAVLAPTNGDYWAVAGAALAALLSGLYVLSERRGYWQLALHIVSASAVGSMAPGIALGICNIIYPPLHATLMDVMTWQWFAGGGFFFGLGGWVIPHSVIRHWQRRGERITEYPFRYMDSSSVDPDDDDDRNS